MENTKKPEMKEMPREIMIQVNQLKKTSEYVREEMISLFDNLSPIMGKSSNTAPCSNDTESAESPLGQSLMDIRRILSEVSSILHETKERIQI